mmetsp:Transcript_26962/g.65493  ORF Transcript_26962/g.65493 Transcript_26962/m.65493 type:complete len:400 (-) Transcript_26962:35-1234(-)
MTPPPLPVAAAVHHHHHHRRRRHNPHPMSTTIVTEPLARRLAAAFTTVLAAAAVAMAVRGAGAGETTSHRPLCPLPPRPRPPPRRHLHHFESEGRMGRDRVHFGGHRGDGSLLGSPIQQRRTRKPGDAIGQRILMSLRKTVKLAREYQVRQIRSRMKKAENNTSQRESLQRQEAVCKRLELDGLAEAAFDMYIRDAVDLSRVNMTAAKLSMRSRSKLFSDQAKTNEGGGADADADADAGPGRSATGNRSAEDPPLKKLLVQRILKRKCVVSLAESELGALSKQIVRLKDNESYREFVKKRREKRIRRRQRLRERGPGEDEQEERDPETLNPETLLSRANKDLDAIVPIKANKPGSRARRKQAVQAERIRKYGRKDRRRTAKELQYRDVLKNSAISSQVW